MQPFATIITQWIDRTGAFADMKQRLGRLGDDVAAYAMHTLGWARIVQISRYSEFAFDARSVTESALASIIEIMRRQGREDGSQLMRVEVFDGDGWLVQSSSDPVHLGAFARRCCERAARDSDMPILHQIPCSVDRIWSLGDPQIRAAATAWRDNDGMLTRELDAAIRRDCPDRSVKLLVPDGGTFRFAQYRGSRTGPWDPNVWNRFLGSTVQDAVPDPLLARSVVQTSEFVVRAKSPRLERCRGPVMATDGVRDFAWYRLSLPVWQPKEGKAGAPHGVLTVLSPDWRDDEAA